MRDGADAAPPIGLVLSLDELRTAFPVARVTAVLECAANCRSGLSPATDGIQWIRGAVGRARGQASASPRSSRLQGEDWR